MVFFSLPSKLIRVYVSLKLRLIILKTGRKKSQGSCGCVADSTINSTKNQSVCSHRLKNQHEYF